MLAWPGPFRREILRCVMHLVMILCGVPRLFASAYVAIMINTSNNYTF